MPAFRGYSCRHFIGHDLGQAEIQVPCLVGEWAQSERSRKAAEKISGNMMKNIH